MMVCVNAFASKTENENDMKTTKRQLGKAGLSGARNDQNCTHPVPKNKYGIVAMHCIANQPMSPADARKVFNGPIAAIESDYQAEIARPADLKKCMKEFDPSSLLLKWSRPLPEKAKITI